ncbi:MAG: hypothetical protein RLZZ308_732 [Candidatus Parcubacteria bacterium]|jgi:hypothetical protein
MSIRALSIQDYLKNINSKISVVDLISIFLSCLIISALFCVVYKERQRTQIPIVYSKGDSYYEKAVTSPSLPFASKYGKTYTYTWCSGASRIVKKNIIYFSSEEEAIKSGRVLSKLCKR